MYSAQANAERPLGLQAAARRWSLYPRTFRALVAAWNTLTILLFTIALLVGLRSALSYMMLNEGDKILAEDVNEVVRLAERTADTKEKLLTRFNLFLHRKAETHEHRKWFGQIRDANGNIVAESDNVPEFEYVHPKSKALTTQTVGSYRIVSHDCRADFFGPLEIYVGAATDTYKEDLTRLTHLIIAAGLILLFLAPLGGFWLAGRVIKPLSNIIAKTAELRPRNLEERLPIRHTGDELDQLSETINGLLDRIADYLERHRELTANVAHELRSPLAAILSSAEVALNQERTTEEYKELLGSIVEESSRLGKLVQQLLMLAESDAGRLPNAKEPVAVDRIVGKAVDMFQGVAESRGIKLESDIFEAVWVTGDAGHLRQVVFNLIDNALKFTVQGSVHVNIRNDSEGHGVLVVKDTGVGIPPEHIPHIFDRFNRGEQRRGRIGTPGTGLGLSICKALVTAHGGVISIKSELGVGTEIRVTLPLRGN